MRRVQGSRPRSLQDTALKSCRQQESSSLQCHFVFLALFFLFFFFFQMPTSFLSLSLSFLLTSGQWEEFGLFLLMRNMQALYIHWSTVEKIFLSFVFLHCIQREWGTPNPPVQIFQVAEEQLESLGEPLSEQSKVLLREGENCHLCDGSSSAVVTCISYPGLQSGFLCLNWRAQVQEMDLLAQQQCKHTA